MRISTRGEGKDLPKSNYNVISVFFVSLALSLLPTLEAQVLWEQPAPNLDAAKGYGYKLYVTIPPSSSPNNVINLMSVTCIANAASPDLSSCQAPVDQAAAVGATMNGAKSELTAVDPSNGFGESEKSTPFIMQNACTPNPVKLNVGTWTRNIPMNGVGQVLYNLRQSTSNITTIVVSLDGMVQDTLAGTRLNNVAGSYFVANTSKGDHQLAVEAIDINGCRDGGAARPMTVTVQ
jgi:hypothetical protein